MSNSSNLPAVDPQITELITLLHDLQIVRYVQVSALGLVTFDYCLTLKDEVTFFWNRRFSLPSFLYYAIRYWGIATVAIANYGFVATLSDTFCSRFNQWGGVVIGLLETMIVQWILLIRIYGLYGGSKSVLIPIVSLWLATFATGAGIAFHENWTVRGTIHAIPGLVTCLPQGSNGALWAFVIPLTIYDSVVFALATAKAISHLRENHFEGSLGYRLMKTMYQDSILYFAAILVAYISEAMVWRFAQGVWIILCFSPIAALLSMMGSRMLINIRRQASSGNKPQTTLSTFGVEIELQARHTPSQSRKPLVG